MMKGVTKVGSVGNERCLNRKFFTFGVFLGEVNVIEVLLDGEF